MYRNDRDWLGEQPPVASPPPFNKPRIDWAARDATTAEALRQKAALLRTQTPPQRVTRLTLEVALDQRGRLEKRLHKLPMCVLALAELTERLDDYQRRRIVWEAEELRRLEQPIQAWRLRRLAGLPDKCTPRVESSLWETACDL